VRRTVLFLAALLVSRPSPAATARLTLDPVKARIGDAIAARVSVDLAPGETLDASPLPSEWGSAQVLSGAWEPATPGGSTRVWNGTIAAYQLGAVTIPPIVLTITKDGAPGSATTEAATISIEGTLPAAKSGDKPPDLMDLKPEASIPPDYGPLKLALTAFAAVLAAAGAAWWLWRRYAAKLAAVAAPVDPFRRLPPHVWVYEELERLLARRLAEEGRIGVFYDELTRIVKQYLEGRYRVDLLERTTSEVPGALLHAGAPQDAGALARALLESGDRVKFAKLGAGPADCRAAVEEAYRLVDMTKPAETGADAAAVQVAS
jgi:hypothetical protein